MIGDAQRIVIQEETGMKEVQFSVSGMKCNGCVTKVRETLTNFPGIVDAEVDLKVGTAVVKGDVDPEAVAKALTDAGYPATPR